MDQVLHGSAQLLIQELKEKKNYSRIVVLVDEYTEAHCLPLIAAALPDDYLLLEVVSGEAQKNLFTCSRLWDVMIDQHIDRRALVINLGGGVITDMGGYVAHSYKRGVDFVHVPTTLLAQVDAAIGGKTGIDHLGLKNVVGAFAFPVATIIDTQFLSTLDQRQLMSGYAEVLKYALIGDAELWDELGETMPQEWAGVVERAVAQKVAVVQEDFKEQARRKTLNFGHTFGHAIESYALEHFEQPLTHGEAVAHGMVIALLLSADKGLLAEAKAQMSIDRIVQLFGKIDLEQFDIDALLEIMRNDKKSVNGEFRFVLLEGIGKARWDVPVNDADLLKALEVYGR